MKIKSLLASLAFLATTANASYITYQYGDIDNRATTTGFGSTITDRVLQGDHSFSIGGWSTSFASIVSASVMLGYDSLGYRGPGPRGAANLIVNNVNTIRLVDSDGCDGSLNGYTNCVHPSAGQAYARPSYNLSSATFSRFAAGSGFFRFDTGSDSWILDFVRLTLNVDYRPQILSITQDLNLFTGESFNFGVDTFDRDNDALTIDWDFNSDGQYDDFSGASGSYSFTDAGIYNMSAKVSDGKYTVFETFAITVEAAEVEVPAPSTFALFLSGMLALIGLRRKALK
ncbi:PEP-CTERM sorting domain-containing protein [Alteromonas lipolytica]|uniref:PKD domain-containing protein n=1 Tax=Alteromonas lipolytica TaxID=1856405 RepID=A0A1E8FDQ8_9ALTE|nr:PEP-CTERM sorting domain-containing protein [Alteromonas lipolytica]OFI33896.1 hypothetical protein BFC17_20235 [Alteromonas lipolytica]GGF67463.1 hypothetical protein GCM10011338_19520 [Alteromonas lipolytica]